jgi:hypothetical protein
MGSHQVYKIDPYIHIITSSNDLWPSSIDISENAVWLVSMLSLRSMSGTLVELEVYVIQ